MKLRHIHAPKLQSESTTDFARKAGNLVVLFDALHSNDSAVSSTAARGLALICYFDEELPTGITIDMLRYFEHLAKFSSSAELREACIDAIYICRDLQRLNGLLFESGCLQTNKYRDQLASKLSAELEMSA